MRKINHYALIFLILLSALPVVAQEEEEKCGTTKAVYEFRSKHGLGSIEDFENWLSPLVEQQKRKLSTSRNVVSMPLIFHIIHNNESVGAGENLSAEVIEHQLIQINNDFRKISGTSGDNSSPVGADTEVQFHLATKDINGNTLDEAGINRIYYSDKGWSSPPYSGGYVERTIKPQSIWDPTQYINVWVLNLSGTLLGRAQFPVESGLVIPPGVPTGADTDGVFVSTYSVGSTDNPNTNPLHSPHFNKGRTLTHELGHFFGLWHIWGSSSSSSTCTTDYCDDTPTQSNPSPEDESCPGRTTCDGNPDMIENYMDYSSDICMNIFTQDQKARIQTVIANSPRRSFESGNVDIAFKPEDTELTIGSGTTDVANIGDVITADFTIRNNGPLDIQFGTDFNVNIYFSENPIRSSTDVLLTDHLVTGPLFNNTNYFEVSTFSLLSSTFATDAAPGEHTWYILFVADEGNMVAESNEGNNLISAEIKVLVGGNPTDKPDFKITSSPTIQGGNELVPGEVFILENIIVENLSGEDNVNYSGSIDYYLSRDDVWEFGDGLPDRLISYQDLPETLKKGESVGPFSTDGLAPHLKILEDWELGESYLLCVTNDNHDDVTNRILPIQLQIVDDFPDLEVLNFSIDQTSINAGDNFTADFRIRNVGAGVAEGFLVGFYIDTDRDVDFDSDFTWGSQLDLFSIEELIGKDDIQPGETTSRIFIDVPTWYCTDPLEYDLMLVVFEASLDPIERVTDNNFDFLKLTYEANDPAQIATHPDLGFGEIDLNDEPTTGIAGFWMQEYVPFYNASCEQFFGDFTVTGYLSTNTSYEADMDRHVFTGSLTNLFSLEAPKELRVGFQIPDDVCQDQYDYLVLRIDPNNEVEEWLEDNNEAALNIQINRNTPCRPDLTWENIEIPETGNAGEVLNLTFDIANRGDSMAFNFDYFIGFNLDSDTGPFNSATIHSGHIDQLDKGEVFTINDFFFTLPQPISDGHEMFFYYVLDPLDGSVDPGQVIEHNEDDNIISKSISVSSSIDPAEPDYLVVVGSVSATSVALPGETIFLDFSVKNEGDGNAGFSSTTIVELIRDNGETWTLVELEQAALGIDQTEDHRVSILIPDVPLEEDYSINVRLDIDDDVKESDEDNNSRSTLIYIGEDPAPDLIATALSVTPTNLEAGEDLSVNYSVLNQGNLFAPASILNFYISDDSIPQVDELVLSTSLVDLDENESFDGTENVPVPANTSFGNKFLIMEIEVEIDVIEDRSNNVSTANFAVGNILEADLIIENLNLDPLTVTTGSTITASATIKNIGDLGAGPSELTFYISANDDLNGATFLASVPVDALGAGASVDINHDMNIDVLAGSYFILFSLDEENEVDESDESNNTGSVNLAVEEFDDTPKPDLVAENISISPTNVDPGNNINFNYTVANNGLLTSATSFVKYYISEDDQLDTSVDEFVDRDFISSLSPGASVSKTEVIHISSDKADGEYYIIFKVDSDENNDESNEANNITFTPFVVGEGPISQADLVIEDVEISPAVLVPGNTLTISAAVKNDGNTTAGTSNLLFYLSEDATLNEVSDLLLVDISIGSLAAGSSSTVNEELIINEPEGTYYIILVADGFDAIIESNEFNNTASMSFAIDDGIGGQPDLANGTISLNPTTITTNGTTNATATITNIGDGTAGASTYKFHISSSDQLADATFVKSVEIDALEASESTSITTDLSFNEPPGTYFVHFEVDGDNEVAETNESNNENSIKIIIEEFDDNPKPDLISTNLSVNPDPVDAGNSITFSYTIHNQGLLNAGTSFVEYYISPDDDLNTATDEFVDRDFVSAINQGASVDRTESIFISSDKSGPYYLFIIVDSEDGVDESLESNNTASIVFTVGEGDPIPDLTVDITSISPSSISSGESITINGNVNNVGDLAAGSNTLVFYLSTDANLDEGSDTELGSVTVNSLGAGESSNFSPSYSISNSTGTYYVFAVVDGSNEVDESNEFNNTDNATFSIVDDPIPDLIGIDISLSPTTISVGGSTTATATISNEGSGTAGPSTISFFISTDDNINNGNFIKSISVGSLVAGESETVSTDIFLDYDAGTYFIHFVVDANNEVNESNESNNEGSVKLIITTNPTESDLIVEFISVNPVSIGENGTINVDYTLKNTGGSASGSSFVGYYISDDNSLNTGNDTFIDKDFISSIDPNGTVSRTESITVNKPEGTYYVFVVADHDDEVSESDEFNNTASVDFEVINEFADLVVESPSVSKDPVEVNETFTLTCTIRNNGAAEAGASHVVFYRSNDANLDEGSDFILGDVSVSNLSVGASTFVSKSFSISEAGDYHIFFVADGLDAVFESNESNNDASVTLDVNTVPVPNLRNGTISLNPTTVASEGTVTANGEVVNDGNAEAGSSEVGFYISSDDNVDNARLIKRISVGSIPAGQSTSYSTDLFITEDDGEYFVHFVVDDNNAVSESNENDNENSVRLTVENLNVDLIVESVSNSPVSIENGGTVNVSYTLKNNGSDAAGNSHVAYYISDDNSLNTASDEFVDKDFVSSISAGGTHSGTESIVINRDPGTYYIFVVADTDDEVEETIESNNTGSDNFEVVAPAPDLRIATANIVEVNVVPGETVTLEVSLENEGGSTAGASVMDFFLSSDLSCCGGDDFLGDLSFGSISAGNSSFQSKTVTIPSGKTAGTYYVYFIADAHSEVAESDENNNEDHRLLTLVEAPDPDLRNGTIDIDPLTIISDGLVTASGEVWNDGPGDAGSSEIGFYISSDDNLNNATFLESYPIGSLTNGNSESYSTSLFISESPGSYFIHFVVDDGNDVAETNEGNNENSVKITVEEFNDELSPDLTIQNVSLSNRNPEAGESISANYDIVNLGDGDAEACNVGIYLSDNSVSFSGADLLGTQPMGGMQPVTTGPTSTGLTIPPSTPNGRYYMHIVADIDDQVQETDENNNVWVEQVRIGRRNGRVGELNDLLPLELEVYPNPTPGKLVVEYALASAQHARLTLTDMRGRELMIQALQKQQDKISLDLSKFDEGMYLLYLQEENGRRIVRRIEKL